MSTRRDFVKSLSIASLAMIILPKNIILSQQIYSDALVDPGGFLVRLIPKGPVDILSFTPQSRETKPDGISDAISFFNKLLYNLPDDLKDCRNHFKKVYSSIPKNVNYYYVVEKHFDINGNSHKQYCFPIGAGESVVDAYATYLLSPHVGPDLKNSFSEQGHFVKARNDGDDLLFEPLADDYHLQKKAAHILSRDRLKKITLSMPLDDAPIPESLQYSRYWLSVTTKYENQIKENHAYDRLSQLNKQFTETEKQFYANVRLYREYKARQAEAARSAGLVSLILQAGSLAAGAYAAENAKTMKDELKMLAENQQALAKEVQLANQNALNNIEQAQQIKTETLNELRRINVPFNDDPKIDIIWSRELY